MQRMNVEREDLASSVAQQLAAVPAPHTSSVLERSERAMLWQVCLVWRAWEEEEGWGEMLRRAVKGSLAQLAYYAHSPV